MTDLLLKNYAIQVEQKLYEKNTPEGLLVVYQTSPFGMMLTLNGQVVISENDGFLYHEMMVHPALFTHPHPERVVIIGHGYGTLQEVLKHPSIKQVICVTENTHLTEALSQYFAHIYDKNADDRVVHQSIEWLSQAELGLVDIIIQDQLSNTDYQYFHRALRDGGILVTPCESSLLQWNALKPIFQPASEAGFHEHQTLHFPQPSYPSGWRTAMMATKNPSLKRIREKDIYNRSFTTRYYNFDTHKAALAIPEFMREEK